MFQIIREKEFESQTIAIIESFSRMAELDEAIDWALSRKPIDVPNTLMFPPDYFLWVTDEFSNLDIPQVRILYKVDYINKIVYLISIQPVNLAHPQIYIDKI